MNAVRIKKEFDVLFWPGCTVVLSSLLFLALPGGLEPPMDALHSMTFWIGVPLLASLSMGHEFQYNTISTLFSQPVDRTRLWLEKWLVLIPLIATATAVYVFVDRTLIRSGYQHDDPLSLALWAVIATCGATFWTLVARSATNGFLLNLLQLAGLGIVADLLRPAAADYRITHNSSIVVVGTAYALLMLWLSYRRLRTFESTGTRTSGELMATRTRESGESSRGIMRCKPSQPLRNLIRKELRLLWPIWLLILIGLLGEMCFELWRYLVPGIAAATPADIIVALALVYMSSVLSVFAGSLSAGEEKVSGTVFIQKALPVSPLKLWLVKVTACLLTAGLALALPYVVGLLVLGGDFAQLVSIGTDPVFPLMLASVAFCCASVVKGTLRAALVVVPVVVLLFSTSGFGYDAYEFFSRTSLLDSLVLKLHPFPFSFDTQMAADGWPDGRWKTLGFSIAAFLLSYRLFRREIPEHFRSVAVALLPLMIASMLLTVGEQIPAAVVRRSNDQWSGALAATRTAVSKLPPASGSRVVTVEELSKVSPLSNVSRDLLRETTIRVTPDFFEMHFKDGNACRARRQGPFRWCGYYW